MIKKYLLLLLFFMSLLGYSQQKVDSNGARTVTITQPAAIVISGTPKNATGNTVANGQINGFEITGGTPNYTQTWSKDGVPFTPVSLTALYAGTYIVTVSDNKSCPKAATFIIKQPDELTVTITGNANSIPCFGGTGSLTANAIGGYPFLDPLVKPKYTYQWFVKENASFNPVYQADKWNPIATGLFAGFYKVIVTDEANNTKESIVVELKQNPIIKATPISSNVLCKNDEGSILLKIEGGSPVSNGGTPNYAVVWKDSNGNGVNSTNEVNGGIYFSTINATAGTYTYTITDSKVASCSISGYATIEGPTTVFSANLGIVNQPSPTANNGAININVTGGYGNYSYVWTKDTNSNYSTEKDLTGLGNGTYSVIVVDKKTGVIAGCSKTIGNIVLQSLSATINIVNPINCIGDTTTLEALTTGGTENYNYKWYKGTDNVNEIGTGKTLLNCGAGDYKVIVNDTKYDFPVTITLNNPTNTPVTIDNTATTNVNCYNGHDGTATITISGGAPINGKYTFDWTGVGTVLNTNTSSTYSGLEQGDYTVTVHDQYCYKSFTFKIEQPKYPITIPNATITKVAIFGESTGAITLDPITGGNGGYTYKWSCDLDSSFSKSTLDISGLKAGSYTLEVRDAKAGVTDNAGCIVTRTFPVTQNPELLVTLQETQSIKCNGDFNGEIKANISGGVSAYSYQWFKNNIAIVGTSHTTIGNLGFGLYKVIVKDSEGAQKTSAILDLIQPDKLTVSLVNKVDVLCHGNETGAIDINVGGGTIPYTFEWKKDGEVNVYSTIEDIEGLKSGVYSVLVTDKNNCEIRLSNITIIQPNAALLITDVEVKNLSGFNTKNGSIEVAISGGTPTYTYAWRIKGISAIIGNSTILDELAIGTYELTVTDSHNCSKTNEYTLTQPDKLEITSVTQTQFIKCNGDKTAILKATVEGGAPIGVLDVNKNYIYKWYNQFTPTVIASATNPSEALLAGNYLLEVSDGFGNSFISNPITISEPEPLMITYTHTNVSCHNGTDGTINIGITGGSGDYKIVWNYKPVDNNNKKDVTILAKGDYTVTVFDNNAVNCSISETITIEEPGTVLAFAAEIITAASGYGLTNGKIKLNIIGGRGGYVYKWYKGINTNDSQSLLTGTSETLGSLVAGDYTAQVTDTNDKGNGCTIEKTFNIQQPELLTLNVVATIAKCNGGKGSLQATAAGGAKIKELQNKRIYTYTLFDSNNKLLQTITGNKANFTNLEIGNYNVIAVDFNENKTTPFSIELVQPTAIEVTQVSIENVSCFDGMDGAITISVKGGTPLIENNNPVYTYQWKRNGAVINLNNNLTLTGLKSGTYTVTVFDNNYDSNEPNYCVGFLNNIIITQPEDFGFDLNKIVPTLPTAINTTDGALHIEIIGGIAPYTYVCKDSNGVVVETKTDSQSKQVDFVSLTTDNYYISVTDATACTKSTAFDFNNNVLTVSLTQATPITCNNGTNANLDAAILGGFGIKTISWYKNNIEIANETNVQLTNVGAGTYYAIVKDFNKVEITSTPIIVTQPDAIVVMASQKEVSCLSGNDGAIYLTASGGSGVYQYRYKSQGSVYGNWILFTDATATLSNLKALSYDIQVQDSKGCNYTTSLNRSVLEPIQLSVNKTAISPTTGFGLSNGSIAITTQGGNGGYTYKWFDKTNAELNQISATITNLLAGQYYVIITDEKGCQITSELFEVTQPDKLVASINEGNSVLCNGDKNGSIKAVAVGGIAGYTYQWFAVNNATPLGTGATLNGIGAGTYFVIATDSKNNSAQSVPFTVDEPAILTNTLSSDYTRCGDANDWTIATTPSGGTAPYTYLWNTGAKTASLQNVPAAKYTVLLTDLNGCSITKEILITAPIHLAAAEVVKIPTCYAGADATITVTASGGKAPYFYLWNTGEKSNVLSNASAGEYTLKVTDSKGCIINHSYTIVNPSKDVINIGEDMTLCIGQSVTINATVDDNLATYSWTSDEGFISDKPIITVSKAATYELVVTNKLGCQASDAIKIAYQDIAIDAVFAVSSQVFVNESFVIVDISNPKADSIEWILPAAATVTAKDKEYAEMSFSKAGEYEMTLITRKGNCSASQTKKILVVEGEYTDPESTDLQKKFDMKIYPNPSNGVFTVEVTLDKIMPAYIKVYNLVNNAIVDTKFENGKEAYTFNFNLNGLTAGVYFVLFESQQGNKLRKIIIQ